MPAKKKQPINIITRIDIKLPIVSLISRSVLINKYFITHLYHSIASTDMRLAFSSTLSILPLLTLTILSAMGAIAPL